MNLYDVFNELESKADSTKAIKMASTMRNQFLFLGIQTPLRRAISQRYFSNLKDKKLIDWNFVTSCWEKPYREAQYVGIDYLKLQETMLHLDDLDKLKTLLIKKSWWDSVDGFHRMIGSMALKFPEINEIMLEWSLDENIWLRRIAINHQLLRKDKVNTGLLEKILINNLDKDEFFISKAIGWSLRDYSKSNPKWVKKFINTHVSSLSKLSIREGSKYL